MEELELLRSNMQAEAQTIQSLAEACAKPDASKEDIEKFDAANAKYIEYQEKAKELQAKIITNDQREERVKRAKEIADYQSKFDMDTVRRPNFTKEQAKQREVHEKDPEEFQKDTALAFAAWTIGGDPAEIPREMVEACKRIGINPAHDRMSLAKIVDRDAVDESFNRMLARAGRASYSAGGFSAALGYADSRDDATLGLTNRMPTYVAAIATNMITYGGIMNSPISVETVQDYEDIVETYTNDQIVGVQIGEGMNIISNQNPTDGNIVWKGWDYSSQSMIVTQRQLDRSRLELPMWIADQLGERLGRRMSIELSNGLGATNPHGIIKAALAGGKTFTSLSAASVTYDDLHSGLTFAIDAVFRNGPGVGWMMSEPIMQYLMRIKDLQGRPMFSWGWEGGNKIRTLEGYPVYINREMITTKATGDKPILFGDFSKFKVVFRKSPIPTLIRDDTTYKNQLKTAFTALINFDARLRDYGNCPIGYLTIS